MDDINSVNEQQDINTGSVNISNDVVSIVASLAAGSIKGVSGMVSSISGGFAELLGKKNMSKGVKVSVTDKKVSLDLAIIVEYGAKIPDVAWEIQEKVKSEVEAMTGLSVVAVNVSVEGVNVPKDDNSKIQPKTVGEKIGETIDKTMETVDDLKSSAMEKAAEMTDEAKEKVSSFTDEVKEKTADVAEDVKEGTVDFIDDLKEKTSEIKSELNMSDDKNEDEKTQTCSSCSCTADDEDSDEDNTEDKD